MDCKGVLNTIIYIIYIGVAHLHLHLQIVRIGIKGICTYMCKSHDCMRVYDTQAASTGFHKSSSFPVQFGVHRGKIIVEERNILHGGKKFTNIFVSFFFFVFVSKLIG